MPTTSTVYPEYIVRRVCKCLKNKKIQKIQKTKKKVLAEFPPQSTSIRHGKPKYQSWHGVMSPTTTVNYVEAGRGLTDVFGVRNVVKNVQRLGPQLRDSRVS